MKLILLSLFLLNCGPVPASVEVGSKGIDKLKEWLETQPAWHSGHCEMSNRYWCNGGQNQCCGKCGSRCN